MTIYFVFAITTLFAATVLAECPNACSGHGSCSAKDMCNCYKNYEGNDCADRTCPFGYAHVDTPKGDLDMDRTIETAWTVTDHQVYKYGTSEFFHNGKAANEAHFYMECSNQGICDRETGTCQCFDGYEGSGCQRAACPNSCSGHGTCESISEFATAKGSGLVGQPVAKAATTYTLWDQKVTYGCKCDPWFGGYDCSERKCKVGVDPLYESVGTEILDTVVIRAATHMGAGDDQLLISTSYIRIRFFDYWGESYVTDRISLDGADDATSAANVAAALKALPNGVIKDVTCEYAGQASPTLPYIKSYISSDVKYTTSASANVLIGCQFITNPGALRIAEIAESAIYETSTGLNAAPIVQLTSSTVRGEDTDWTGNKDNIVVTTLTGTTITFTGTTLIGSSTAAPDTTNPILAKVKDQYVLISATPSATTFTIIDGWTHTDLASASETLFFASGVAVTVSARTAAITVGATAVTLSGATDLTAGSPVMIEGQIYYVKSTSASAAVLDRPFFGKKADGADATASAIYKITIPTSNTYTYVSECSGRGLCDTETGVCACFKGYTNDNCDTQNTLAF